MRDNGASGSEAATSQIADDFVGRADAVAQLDRLRHAAASGTGRLVLLFGEAGIGKSRLGREIVDRAAVDGMRVARGTASADEGRPPYWPFRQVLRDLATPAPDGSDRGIANMPDLDELDGASGSSTSPAARRFSLFEAIADHLAAASEPNGLAVQIDDLHWADAGSLQLLVHLASRIGGARLLIVATCRSEEDSVDAHLRSAVAALTRVEAVTRIELAGLAADEVSAVLAGIAGWPVPPSVAAAIGRRTGGNPFYVRALGQLLTADPSSDPESALPASVRDVVRDRLDRLGPAARRVVCTAAVLGTTVDDRALAVVLDVDLPSIWAATDEAVRTGILGGTPVRRFVHDLVRETAAAALPQPDRMRAHAAMVRYLLSDRDPGRRTAELAFHGLAALPLGDPRTAYDWTRRAAEAALGQLAWEDAARLYARGAEVAASAGVPPDERRGLLLALARAQVQDYDTTAAIDTLGTVADLAQAADDPAGIAEAALTLDGVTDPTELSRIRGLQQRALDGQPPGDSPHRARLLAQLAVTLGWTSPAESRKLAGEALSMAERLDDPRSITEALRSEQIAHSGPDGVHDRLQIGERMLLIGVVDADDNVLLWGRLWRFDALVQLGRIAVAEADLADIAAVADRLHSPLAAWHAVRTQAVIALARGDFGKAAVLGEELAHLARRSGSTVPSFGYLALLGMQTGIWKPVSEESLRAVAAGPPGLLAIRAASLLNLGRRADAERLFRLMPPLATVPGFLLLPALGAAAQLAVGFDDRPLAAEVYRLLRPHRDLFVSGGAGVVAVLGSARAPLGLAARTLGRLDEAAGLLRQAAAINEAAGLPPMALRARFDLAITLARRGRDADLVEAAALARSAAARAAQLGMEPLRRDSDALAARLAGVAGPLTAREAQLAGLLAQGLTNRQIAAIEHLSERTVENHVRNILGKLGFTSRAQVAVWVAERPADILHR